MPRRIENRSASGQPIWLTAASLFEATPIESERPRNFLGQDFCSCQAIQAINSGRPVRASSADFHRKQLAGLYFG